MTKPIINLDQLKYGEFGKGKDFLAERAGVAEHIGAKNSAMEWCDSSPVNVRGPITRIMQMKSSFMSWKGKERYAMPMKNIRYGQATSLLHRRTRNNHTR